MNDVAPSPTPAPSLLHDLGLALWQVRYEQRIFWRNRAGAFFALLMPVMFLVIFASLNGGTTISSRGGIS